MKKIALVVLLSPAIAFAADTRLNPDKVPSVGFTAGHLAAFGDSTAISGSARPKQDVSAASTFLIGNVRVPLSNSVSVNLELAGSFDKSDFKETSALAGGEGRTKTISGSAGVRYYFQK